MFNGSTQLSPESKKRYSQMTEAEAAQEFDRRKQALIQNLNQRIQKKSTQAGKSIQISDLLKPSPQAQYIVFSPKSSQSIGTPFSTRGKLQSPKEENNDKQSVKSSPKNEMATRNLEQQKIVQSSDGASYYSYGSKERFDSMREHSEQKKVDMKYESSPSHRENDKKKNLLGQLGQLDVEIERLRVETEKELRTIKKDSIVSEVGPKKPQVPEVEFKGIREVKGKNLSQHTQSPKKGCSTYSSRVENKRKNILSDFHQRIFCKELKQMQIGHDQPQLKPLNIMIQFKQSIDNSRNMFSPNIQIQKDSKELSKHDLVERRRTSQGATSQQSYRKGGQQKQNKFIQLGATKSQNYQLFDNLQGKKQPIKKMKTQNSPTIKSSYQHSSRGAKLKTEESVSDMRSRDKFSPAKNAQKSINEAVELYTNLKNLLTKSQPNFNNTVRRQTSADLDYYNNDVKTKHLMGSGSSSSIKTFQNTKQL